MKKLLALVVAIALLAMPTAHAVSVKGSQGQQLTVSATTAKNGSMITVSGNRFDETVGIYLAYCVVPKKGELPTPCGGGVNKAGTGESSFWISSNPPPYAIGLTDEFSPGGRFTHKVKISKKIGKFDCTKVKCAITVRADHLRGNDRSYDMFVPVKIK
jgi:opacity protein-like surface antigen